jgi:hypothetical protein
LDGLLIFFLGGRGRGRGTPGHDCRGVFADDTSSKQSCYICYILYIAQWKFRCRCVRQARTVVPILDDLGQTRALFGFRQPVDLVPH